MLNSGAYWVLWDNMDGSFLNIWGYPPNPHVLPLLMSFKGFLERIIPPLSLVSLIYVCCVLWIYSQTMMEAIFWGVTGVQARPAHGRAHLPWNPLRARVCVCVQCFIFGFNSVWLWPRPTWLSLTDLFTPVSWGSLSTPSLSLSLFVFLVLIMGCMHSLCAERWPRENQWLLGPGVLWGLFPWRWMGDVWLCVCVEGGEVCRHICQAVVWSGAGSCMSCVEDTDCSC